MYIYMHRYVSTPILPSSHFTSRTTTHSSNHTIQTTHTFTMRAAIVPFTFLVALFGQTIFAQSCQPDGGSGFNINVGDLDSVRCCSGCGWNSCRLGDVCCFTLIHQNTRSLVLTLLLQSQGTLYYCPSASGSTCNLQPSICG